MLLPPHLDRILLSLGGVILVLTAGYSAWVASIPPATCDPGPNLIGCDWTVGEGFRWLGPFALFLVACGFLLGGIALYGVRWVQGWRITGHRPGE